MHAGLQDHPAREPVLPCRLPAPQTPCPADSLPCRLPALQTPCPADSLLCRLPALQTPCPADSLPCRIPVQLTDGQSQAHESPCVSSPPQTRRETGSGICGWENEQTLEGKEGEGHVTVGLRSCSSKEQQCHHKCWPTSCAKKCPPFMSLHSACIPANPLGTSYCLPCTLANPLGTSLCLPCTPPTPSGHPIAYPLHRILEVSRRIINGTAKTGTNGQQACTQTDKQGSTSIIEPCKQQLLQRYSQHTEGHRRGISVQGATAAANGFCSTRRARHMSTNETSNKA